MESQLGFSGKLGARRIAAPGPGVLWKLRNLPNVLPGVSRHALAKALGMNHMLGALYATLRKADGSVVNYGMISTNLVTDAFAEYMVDELQAETAEWGDFKFHDSGVGVTPAAVGDTDIETTDGETRSTGTQIEGASAEIYKSVGTISYSSGKAITEHALCSIVTGGTMMDHHVFDVINVVNGDSIAFTYELTVTSGG